MVELFEVTVDRRQLPADPEEVEPGELDVTDPPEPDVEELVPLEDDVPPALAAVAAGPPPVGVPEPLLVVEPEPVPGWSVPPVEAEVPLPPADDPSRLVVAPVPATVPDAAEVEPVALVPLAGWPAVTEPVAELGPPSEVSATLPLDGPALPPAARAGEEPVPAAAPPTIGMTASLIWAATIAVLATADAAPAAVEGPPSRIPAPPAAALLGGAAGA